MGEEEKKPEKAAKPAGEGKKEGAPKTEENSKGKMQSEEPKAAEQPQLPLPPPQEIILKVYMHCEGCARKVRRCLKDFEGVEDVITDCRTSKVVVKGEKADPLKVLERVQKKSQKIHRQVELISPIPKPPGEDHKKPEEIIPEVAKSEEKKKEEEPPVVTVVLGVYMHCEACALEIKKRIQKIKGVESAEPDLKSSQVTVKGVFEPEKLVDHVWKRTGKRSVIAKVEPEMKPEEGKVGDKVKKVEEGEKETKKVEKNEEIEEKNSGVAGNFFPAEAGEEEDSKMEFKRNEFIQNYPRNHQVYPQRFAQDSYAAYLPPPQIFSDENPNACFVM
ncbi:heavy metal-associated isoprenylated plant protein 7-like [Primulina eburnea]|uniref:heavy metal-associated isoprenylated plant protein 7-like n=1 Tax=Primulina eburnea TaxID=1245227 RepID=UPI003C6BF10C